MRKARRLQYCVSVVYMSLDPAQGESDPDPDAAARLAKLAGRQLRSTDVVTTISSSTIGLLLVDAETYALPGIVHRATEALEANPVTVTGRETRVTWSAGAGCYPQTATTERDLLRQASDHLARARQEGGRRLYVAS